MTNTERSACRELHAYMATEDNLLYELRMMWDWHDEEFRKVVELSTRCLREIDHDELIPRYVARFVSEWLGVVRGIMQNPSFLQHNRAGRTEQETSAYFARRVEIIDKLVSWMSNGTCPYPPEHFVLPEWKMPSIDASPE